MQEKVENLDKLYIGTSAKDIDPGMSVGIFGFGFTSMIIEISDWLIINQERLKVTSWSRVTKLTLQPVLLSWNDMFFSNSLGLQQLESFFNINYSLYQK